MKLNLHDNFLLYLFLFVCGHGNVQYCKIPKISPFMYNPLQMKAPQTQNAKKAPLNHPSSGGLYLEMALK